MSKFLITGNARLSGSIAVGGAKNSALKIIPAAILSDQPITISNLPRIEDIDRSLELLVDLGAQVERQEHQVIITAAKLQKHELSPTFANKLRASIMFVGPLLARYGRARFPHPGGCVIGAGTRPIDLFLAGWQAMGAEIKFNHGFYELKAKRLRGCDFFFTTVSVTGTESMILSAVLADGKTILKNCAMEPEIVALADYLNAQGAQISGAGSPTIIIEGCDSLMAGEFIVPPDRIETGTFAIMAAATNSEITITACRPAEIEILLNIFKKIGITFTTTENQLIIHKHHGLIACDIKTHEYPGLATDLQSPYTVLMTQAQGASLIHETIYDRRLLFTDMLTQMGANIVMCDPHRVVVNGQTKLTGHKLTSPDLRAGIAMVIAGLIADGQTEIDNIYQIDRGYENIDQRLRALGAKIERID